MADVTQKMMDVMWEQKVRTRERSVGSKIWGKDKRPAL